MGFLSGKPGSGNAHDRREYCNLVRSAGGRRHFEKEMLRYLWGGVDTHNIEARLAPSVDSFWNPKTR
jgi:hypothetical protein